MEQAKKRMLKMSPEEIRMNYTEAKNKGEQVKILSELNLCSKEDIREVLLEQGVPEGELPKARAQRKTTKGKEQGVPETVRAAVAERIGKLTDEMAEMKKELKELNAFLEATGEPR